MSEPKIIPEVGKWYELKGGAIVPCVGMTANSYMMRFAPSDEHCPSGHWVYLDQILREVPAPSLSGTHVKCPTCKGNGVIPDRDELPEYPDCPTCHGEGYCPVTHPTEEGR